MPSLRAALVLPLLWSTAFAQCDLLPMAGDPVPHATGTVNAIVNWDPDGAGPQAQVQVFAGRFSAGTLTGVSIAFHDGTAWQPLGTPPGVSCTAMTVWNGQLVVAASTNSLNSSRLSTWNGSSWVPLGMFGTVSGYVRSFATFQSRLVAGGDFSVVDSVLAQNIAQWDGSTWSALGTGITGEVRALAPFAGALHVGGAFSAAGGLAVSNHALWNGSQWFAGATFNGRIESFAVRQAIAITQTYLFAGGEFTAIGALAAAHVARLTQSTNLWSAMGTGITCTTVNELFVRTFGVSSFEVTATALGTSDEVWRWSGTAWNPLGSLFDDSASAQPSALGYLGGYVLGLANATLAVREFDGVQAWPPLLGRGIDERVYDSCSLGNDTVIAGAFTTISGVTMNGIARGNPGAWSPLGTGLEGGFGVFAVATLPNGDLVAGGSFTTAGGVPAQNLARWNGTSWSQFGGGVNDIVYALAVMPGGDLVAAGRFTAAGGLARNRIARWNGTTWLALGSGSPSQLNALHVAPNGELLVGGNFTTIGGVAASRIARWNGAWWAFGNGVDNAVWSIATTSSGEPVIGGAFTFSGTTSVPYLAKWNGSAWVYPGSTFAYHPTSDVLSVAVLPDGDIVACGAEWNYTISIPPILHVEVTGNVARLDASSTTWSALDVHGSFVQHVRALPEGGLAVGGLFGDDRAANFAKLLPTCPASVQDLGVGCNGQTLTAVTLPWVESTFVATGTNLPTTAIVLAVTSLTSIPQGLAPLGAFFTQGLPGCDALVLPDILGALVTTNGTATSSTFLPNTPPLVGVTFFHQMVPIAVDAQGAWTAITATNALQLTAGSF
ncbi:MAG: hypothetical protein JNL08_12870 [Planctomycetes bacterium]|nr:hypothetical protein [Planctomycetota bacterium]